MRKQTSSMVTRLRRLFPVLIIALLVAACSTVAAPGEGSKQSQSRPDVVRVGITVGHTSTMDVPLRMTFELLAERGYKIEPISFATSELTVAGLVTGDVNLNNGPTRTHWTAIAKGAEIFTAMEQAANAWSIASRRNITACADLQGKRVAISSVGSNPSMLLNAYIQASCPGTEPNIVLIQSPEARAAALLSGEIDAQPMDTGELLRLQRQAPDRIHRLADLATSLPTLKTSGIHVNRSFAKQYPEVVKDFVETLLTVHRRIKNEPAVLEEAIAKHMGIDKQDAAESARVYLAGNVWDVNGGMDPESATRTIAFMAKMGILPAELTEAKVIDRTFLNQVLDKIGRR